MSNTEIKTQIVQYLEKVDDSFLKAVHSMLKTYVKEQEETIIGYDIDGKLITASEARKQYAKDIKKVKEGKFSTIKKVRKKSEKWLKSTK